MIGGLMSRMEVSREGIGMSIILILLIVLCYYFTLTFFESLRKGDERIIKQSKFAAIICMAIALVIGIIY
ncbi:hypothetical protein ATG70_2735 [Bacillus sp. es.036]|nr:hypothetical protein ATG70_2735 [Bacillus sp. es.036]